MNESSTIFTPGTTESPETGIEDLPENGFGTLPLELWGTISDFLSWQDLFAWSLTCKMCRSSLHKCCKREALQFRLVPGAYLFCRELAIAVEAIAAHSLWDRVQFDIGSVTFDLLLPFLRFHGDTDAEEDERDAFPAPPIQLSRPLVDVGVGAVEKSQWKRSVIDQWAMTWVFFELQTGGEEVVISIDGWRTRFLPEGTYTFTNWISFFVRSKEGLLDLGVPCLCDNRCKRFYRALRKIEKYWNQESSVVLPTVPDSSLRSTYETERPYAICHRLDWVKCGAKERGNTKKK